jgi:hypothetical protein
MKQIVLCSPVFKNMTDINFGDCSLMELNLHSCHSQAYTNKAGKQKLEKICRKGSYCLLQSHHRVVTASNSFKRMWVTFSSSSRPAISFGVFSNVSNSQSKGL